MADQPKKKNPSLRKDNSDRRNKKAFKRPGSSRNRKSPQTELQKALMGGGAIRRIARRVEGSTDGAWKMGSTVHTPFDAAQARLNKHLYPHLF